jgi:UDP-N-acetylmuramate dehydrogenase
LIDPSVVLAGAGVSCAKVAKFSARADLLGAEFLAGIPGTLGGALAMNAGAFGSETWPLVKRVQTISRDGNLYSREPKDYQLSYRTVNGPADEWFVNVELLLQAGNGEQAQQRIKALLEKRGATQPTQLPSCGSVFRNPPGDHAARLIEACGLKESRIGAAQVSAKHANFIINTGGAAASDIEALIYRVQSEVEQQTGIKLQTEVRITGEASVDGE